MPTYDYQCTACSHAFEHFQSMKDKPLRKCPACGKSTLQRLIGTGAAVLFKGSGFYQTDYRSEGYKKAADADKPTGSTSEVGAGGKGDGKPDTKAGAASETKAAASEAKKVNEAGGSSSHGKEAPKSSKPEVGKPKAGRAAKR
ncbi:MAG: zinc ribbon domain-containing protein [Phycisphaerales bacterium]